MTARSRHVRSSPQSRHSSAQVARPLQTEAVRSAQGQSQGRLEEAQHCQHRRQLNGHVRFGSLAIRERISDVRFAPESGHVERQD